jgi:hypothetical protein
MACLMGGIEAALIFALRAAQTKHMEWPLTLMAVLSAVLLSAGVLRHYYDIWVHRTVRGISFIFVGIDAAGDLFSLVSVVFQPKLDILGMIIYGCELVLWLGVFACGGYFNFMPWVKARREQSQSNSKRIVNAQTESSLQQPNNERRTDGIALHELPSSTSVFRTPSNAIGIMRARVSTFQSASQDISA